MPLVTIFDVVSDETLNDQDEAISEFINPEEERFHNYRYKILQLSPSKAKTLFLSATGETPVYKAFQNASPSQRKIVKEKIKNFDDERVIVASNRTLLDGYHHLIAAIQLNKPISYIDIQQPIQTKQEDFYSVATQAMCLLEDRLEESLERSYPFHFQGGDGQVVTYEFKNKQDQLISVDVLATDANPVFSPKGSKEIVFSAEDFDVQALTGSGDALAVVTTVAKIMLDFMKRWAKKNHTQPYKIQWEYSPTSEKSTHDLDSKRAKLYNKIFRRVIIREYPEMEIYRWDNSFTLEEKRQDEEGLQVVTETHSDNADMRIVYRGSTTTEKESGLWFTPSKRYAQHYTHGVGKVKAFYIPSDLNLLNVDTKRGGDILHQAAVKARESHNSSDQRVPIVLAELAKLGYDGTVRFRGSEIHLHPRRVKIIPIEQLKEIDSNIAV